MKSEPELSDKEWRQMRRQLSKLDFEPVPETPTLLPRSLYGEIDQEGGEEQEEKTERLRPLSASNHNDSPEQRSSTATCSDPSMEKQSMETVRISGDELPSSSMAVSPLIMNRVRPRADTQQPDSKVELGDAEIAALSAQMAAAQEATRRSVLNAFFELKARSARIESLERTKLLAAHENDVKILKSKMEELQEQIVRAEAQQKQRDEMLDRFSEFTAKRLRLIQKRWGGQHLLAACFRAWNKATQRTVAKRSALRRLLGQRYKRQQLVSFYHWKVNVQQLQQQNQLQDQRDRYEDRIVGTDKEYQLKIHQLQQEIEEAKSQVAESQKCRQKLEEDLRLIFLRGVSAMNIEALTVFGSNHSQNLKLGDLGQWVPPSRQQEKKQIAIPTKTTISSSANDLSVGVPEGIRPPEIPNPNSSLGAKLSAPVRIEAPSSVHASPSHGRVPVVRTQMQPSISRASNSWRVSSSSGLRSAEMIRLHELSSPVGHQIMSRSALSFARKSSAPSPTKRRSSSQSNTKYQVELQYMRSTVAPRLSGGGRTVSSTRSPQSSATRRRA